MTGASSNIGCLEALPRVALLQLAQSALRALLYIVYKRLYTLGYTKVQYTVYEGAVSRVAACFAALHSGRRAKAYRGTCHSACTPSITERRLPRLLFPQ